MAEIRFASVVKRFGDVTVIPGFSATVHEGEFLTLLGPSGCGKTTMLRILAGFERATDQMGDWAALSFIGKRVTLSEAFSNLCRSANIDLDSPTGRLQSLELFWGRSIRRGGYPVDRALWVLERLRDHHGVVPGVSWISWTIPGWLNIVATTTGFPSYTSRALGCSVPE